MQSYILHEIKTHHFPPECRLGNWQTQRLIPIGDTSSPGGAAGAGLHGHSGASGAGASSGASGGGHHLPPPINSGSGSGSSSGDAEG